MTARRSRPERFEEVAHTADAAVRVRGAAPDMGRYSFVLAGNAQAMTSTFGSSCHGAGRLMSRKAATKAARGRRIDEELRARGVQVMARGYKTLTEEMSDAYKDVADVVDVIDGAGVSRKVSRLVPVGVIKG